MWLSLFSANLLDVGQLEYFFIVQLQPKTGLIKIMIYIFAISGFFPIKYDIGSFFPAVGFLWLNTFDSDYMEMEFFRVISLAINGLMLK